jgi:hypothetical protein
MQNPHVKWDILAQFTGKTKILSEISPQDNSQRHTYRNVMGSLLLHTKYYLNNWVMQPVSRLSINYWKNLRTQQSIC